ncbi:glycine dehydrogenase (decarboxylating) [mine drainage metagenome]|uniref:Glycine dehydrogenase (Decarboxylating) n=1 Tax=mine drainage metagenome TaxID=410659 RepID=A0A1J5P8U1_9ZZZZ
MGMFVRAYAYILSHGSDGLRQAAEDAVLSANFVRVSLADLFSQPFGERVCMHEVLFDDAWLRDTGVTTLDFAKAMIDEGYHPMTIYFPLVVHGAMLIEPTESESRAELDRFCDAMIAIRREIAEIENGRWKVESSPLRHAPHTVHDIADDAWQRPYSRAEGCFPAGTSRVDKYWSPVGRVDNVYGDRHLVCSCPPVTEYAEAAE